MTTRSKVLHARALAHDCEAIGSTGAMRLLLLEVATELQLRPVRSVVARRALDEVAAEILRLATESESSFQQTTAAS